MRNGEWAKEVEGRHRLSLLSGIGAGTAVAAAALDGIENAANLLSRLRNHRVVLLHAGKDLPDLLPVLCHLIHLPEDDLAQVPNKRGDSADLAPEVLKAGANLCKPGRRPVHLLPENPREPFQRQRLICVRHGSP